MAFSPDEHQPVCDCVLPNEARPRWSYALASILGKEARKRPHVVVFLHAVAASKKSPVAVKVRGASSPPVVVWG